jgi:hypothetical protein
MFKANSRIFVVALIIGIVFLSGCRGKDACEKFSGDKQRYRECYDLFLETVSDAKSCETINFRCSGEELTMFPSQSECDAQFTSWNKDACYNNVAIKIRDYTICKKIKGTSDQYKEEYCMLNIAASKGDISICDKIKGPNSVVCLLRIQRAKPSASICERVTEDPVWQPTYSNKYECYYEVALSTRDAKLCEKITIDAAYKQRCIDAATKGADLCTNDDCLINWALGQKDIATCNRIQNPTMKEDCIRMLS